MNEENLLLRLCRLELREQQVNEIRIKLSDVRNWSYFTSLANEHGIAALVYHNLERYKLLGDLPEEEKTFLRVALMKSLSRNTFNTESMGEVLRLLNAENIQTVLLKGLALELTEYGNAGLRQMNDIDVLIARDQCMTARKILINNGFVSLPVKSPLHKLIIADLGKHLPSLRKNGTSVEIHHSLFGGRNDLLTKKVFETCSEIKIKGENTFVPEPQIFFLYLVRHLNMHEISNESQLRLYTDLVVLLDKHFESIINQDLLNLASQAGISEILASKLKVLNEIWNITFPEWINRYIEKWNDPLSIQKFYFFLKSPKNNPPLGKDKLYRQIYNDIPGITRKVLFLAGDLLPSISFMKKRHRCNSTLKVLFYYPRRAGKIIWLLKK
jgi:hypothetical protein